MTEQNPSYEDFGLAAPSRVTLQPPLQPASTSTLPPPPPITLNPPSQQADDFALAIQLDSPKQQTPIPHSVFSSLRPPRSSSLHVHSSSASVPRPTSPSLTPGAAAPPAAHRDNARPPVSLKRPTTPSSLIEKANSHGLSPREGSRARNRWSTSTISSTSSLTSPFGTRHTKGGSGNRRASLEVTALRGSPPSARSSPRASNQGRLQSAFANQSTSVTTDSGHMGTLGVSQPAMGYHGANYQRAISPSPSKSRPLPGPRLPYDQNRDLFPDRSHSRERPQVRQGSHDLGKRMPKPLSQKAMLSRALQKANTAVQLDNAQNLGGARQAYNEACDLLCHVLHRTTIDEDKRKLEVIRQTYTSRIAELDQMGPWQDDTAKALPARPDSDEFDRDAFLHHYQEPDEGASRTEPIRKMSLARSESRNSNDRRSVRAQVQRLNNAYLREISQERRYPGYTPDIGPRQSSLSRQSSRTRSREDGLRFRDSLAPPPLASIRPASPMRTRADDVYDPSLDIRTVVTNSHIRLNESTSASTGKSHTQDAGQSSWLDPLDESGDSTRTSVHSRTSSLGYRRRHIRAASGNTEAEFDSALDAAIEAAYNEGYEPMGPEDYDSLPMSTEAMSGSSKTMGLGEREQMRSTEREMFDDTESLRRTQVHHSEEPRDQVGFYNDDSSDEERILEEINRDFAIEDFTMGQQLRPVEEDWRDVLDSTFASDFRPISPLSNASLLSERPQVSSVSKTVLPSIPPPVQSLPKLPQLATHNRQGSGPKSKQLKIETTNLMPVKTIEPVEPPNRDSSGTTAKSEVPSIEESNLGATVGEQSSPSPPSAAAASLSEPPNVSFSPGKKVADMEDGSITAPASPSVVKMRKKFSSSSLRSMRSRNMSLSNLEEVSDVSPSTPSSFTMAKLPAVPALPAGLAATFKDQAEISSSGGLHLFDDNFHQANTLGLPNSTLTDAPVPLEPCPTDAMLRPFWLMRCLFQTLVNPRGGYLSTKLFVPRDVWRVKGVKLKNIDEKISQCDFLTAALLKLSRVDTLDADALLIEMQDLESVLEQAQTVLSRKLGHEVGVQGSGMFKDVPGSTDGDGGSGMPRSGSVSNKSSSGFSWRRLRSKPSTIGLGSASIARVGPDGTKDGNSTPLLPMTQKPTNRPAKRDLTFAQFTGPNAHYMASLARLFDAAQAIDQIARQVDDPGLRHVDKTQVGLELCTRHAAEFFGFYICRFVLADLGLLLDKFIKRGSEWVLN